jgi:hypothetical protein
MLVQCYLIREWLNLLNKRASENLLTLNDIEETRSKELKEALCPPVIKLPKIPQNLSLAEGISKTFNFFEATREAIIHNLVLNMELLTEERKIPTDEEIDVAIRAWMIELLRRIFSLDDKDLIDFNEISKSLQRRLSSL